MGWVKGPGHHPQVAQVYKSENWRHAPSSPAPEMGDAQEGRRANPGCLAGLARDTHPHPRGSGHI